MKATFFILLIAVSIATIQGMAIPSNPPVANSGEDVLFADKEVVANSGEDVLFADKEVDPNSAINEAEFDKRDDTWSCETCRK